MTDHEKEISLNSIDYLLLYIQKGLREFYESRTDENMVAEMLDIISSIEKRTMEKGIYYEHLEAAFKVLNASYVFNKIKTGVLL